MEFGAFMSSTVRAIKNHREPSRRAASTERERKREREREREGERDEVHPVASYGAIGGVELCVYLLVL